MSLINPSSSPSCWITTLNEKLNFASTQHANGVATWNVDNIMPNVDGLITNKKRLLVQRCLVDSSCYNTVRSVKHLDNGLTFTFGWRSLVQCTGVIFSFLVLFLCLVDSHQILSLHQVDTIGCLHRDVLQWTLFYTRSVGLLAPWLCSQLPQHFSFITIQFPNFIR